MARIDPTTRSGAAPCPPLTDPALPDAVLLAGFGMQARHLQKYETLYRRLGVPDVHAFVPGVLNGTWPRRCDAYAKVLARRLEELDRPIVLHVFSGGVWVYYALNAFASDALRRRIVAVVFESTPLDVTPEQFGRFAAWFLGRRYHAGWSWPFVPYRWLVGISPRWEARNVQRMLNLPRHLQVLGIFADDDPVADPGFIASYLRALETQGLTVRALRLQAARHCLALRDACDRYVGALVGLLAEVRQLPSAAPEDAVHLVRDTNVSPDMAHLLAACGCGGHLVSEGRACWPASGAGTATH